MRTAILVLLALTPAGAQFHLGVKAGVPLSDAFETARSGAFGASSPMVRYTVGPMVELSLPFGLGVEADALYKRQHFSSFGQTFDGRSFHTDTYANSWEFPLLLKKRFWHGPLRPYLAGGVSINTMAGVHEISRTFTNAFSSSGESGGSALLENRTRAGLVLGGGFEIRALFLRVAPEIRYTRWGSESFRDASGFLRSNDNQAEVLLGLSF